MPHRLTSVSVPWHKVLYSFLTPNEAHQTADSFSCFLVSSDCKTPQQTVVITIKWNSILMLPYGFCPN